MTNLITAQDIADFAPDLDTSQYSATTLSGLIAQASVKIAAYCNVTDFALGTYTDKDRARISNNGELLISPMVRPAQSVASISLKSGGFSTNLTLSDNQGNLYYDINGMGTRITVPNSYLYATGTFLAGGNTQLLSLKQANLYCTITYTAGWQTIPFDLKDACVLYVQDQIMRRNNRAGVQSFSQGSLSMTYGANGTDESGNSRIIQQAQSILLEGDYVRPEIH